jgi:Ser/Thr protein kinase RdoA (MazF antagonist)
MTMIPAHVQRAFNLKRAPFLLEGGTRDVYHVNDVVIKQVVSTTFENPHTFELLPWLAEQLIDVKDNGFRLSHPVRSVDGEWIVEGSWTAWTYVEGQAVHTKDLNAAIMSIQALHYALRCIPRHPALDRNESAWGFAHKHCFGERPNFVHPVLEELVDALYALRQPLPPMKAQVIHGDLNRENVLTSPGLPVGFVDLTPFWAPVDFALAMFANWMGPRQGDVSVLKYFEDIPYFEQLLLRAAIRMLLVVSHLEGVAGWEMSSEKEATEIVLAYID